MDPYLDRDPEEPERHETAADLVEAGLHVAGFPVGSLSSSFGRDMRRMVWWAMGLATVVVTFGLMGDEPTDSAPAALALLWLLNVLIWMALLALGARILRRARRARSG